MDFKEVEKSEFEQAEKLFPGCKQYVQRDSLTHLSPEEILKNHQLFFH